MAIARLTFSARYGGQILQNVLHFRKDDYVTADLAALCTNFRDHWLDAIGPAYVAEVQYLSLHAEQLASGGGGDVYDLVLSSNGAGGSDTRVPLQLAMVVQLRSGLAGRRNRGRFYLFGITCNWLASGIWNPTNLATVQGYLNTLSGRWLAGTEDYGWRLVIHGKDDGPSESRDVITLQARSLPGTQRRRQVGVGI